DVGLDTYHHTFFEMLGNWSFGDYFKKEAISWAWELVVNRWKFPAERLYATIYNPDKSVGDPSDRDEEAWGFWAEKFRSAGLDPQVHIVNGNKKDNFWMMGDTGPCGPCSELHVDLTPKGNTKGSLVNSGDARCIEIWNLVFIQFNANPDGSFSPLPAQHVDTGMGFERVASIIQGTKNFTDFANAKVSNYETDIFRPIFDEIEKLSGKAYGSTLPDPSRLASLTPQQTTDIAFRVIADHIRTLSFAIADGIQPGNTDRNYVLRRILRRAVRYGRSLGFHGTFFHKLVPVLAREMGSVFPELRAKQKHVEEVLKREEESFNRTLDKGIELFETEAARSGKISGEFAFRLYDEQGFPLDLTELMARERGLAVDVAAFETLMEAQRARARAAQKKQVIALSEIQTKEPTNFLGYDHDHTGSDVLEVVSLKDKTAVVLNNSVCYAEMGGQVGDTGELRASGKVWRIANTQKSGGTWLHFLEESDAPAVGDHVTVQVESGRRAAIQRHHTVTHLLHWALHEVVSREATQKGSFVGPDKLTFDFNHAALTAEQLRDVESLVNERIRENATVSWKEVPYAEVRGRADIMQFFGDKYGETVRVVQIGGEAGGLNGYSMELCAGTHARTTGDIACFKIVSEGAIAAGVRRIEAVAGEAVLEWAAQEGARQDERFAGLLRKREDLTRLPELLRDPDAHAVLASLEARRTALECLEESVREWEKQNAKALEAGLKVRAAAVAGELADGHASQGFCVAEVADADGKLLQSVAEILRSKCSGPVYLAGAAQGRVALVAAVPKDLAAKVQAGKLIQETAPLVGGKGGGRPDLAQGGGTDPAKISEALAKARSLIEAALG
ncbi:MAG TPA: alanine--tRNA ligase, partial [Terrimicrobiaceae bacterium]|nr:alanine--tRNA ligase [Terrimicrobiaceae bacterium]